LKTPYRHIDLQPGFGMARTVRQRANKRDVRRFIERRDFDELPQYVNTFFRRQYRAEALKQPLAQLTKAVPLAHEPVFERWRPFDREAFEKVAAE
jgi:hypothetical protein